MPCLEPITRVSCPVQYKEHLLRPSQPSTQLVTDRWELDELVVMAGSLGMIVMEVDGRGAAGKGENWRKLLVGSLGEIDIEDQLEAIRYRGYLNVDQQ